MLKYITLSQRKITSPWIQVLWHLRAFLHQGLNCYKNIANFEKSYFNDFSCIPIYMLNIRAMRISGLSRLINSMERRVRMMINRISRYRDSSSALFSISTQDARFQEMKGGRNEKENRVTFEKPQGSRYTGTNASN